MTLTELFVQTTNIKDNKLSIIAVFVDLKKVFIALNDVII